MSTVNPAAIASNFRKVFEHKEITWLREHVNGTERRNLVWALERLCFAHESYHDGVVMMAQLAVAENEDIGNSATEQLIQLFHINLAGTEVDLRERLNTLKELVNKGGEYIPLVIRCFEAALQNGGFLRVGGAEKFGFENRKDYTPKTWSDIFEYWYGCRDLLLEWLNKKPQLADLLAEIVEKNIYNWIRGGQKNVLVPLLEKIAEIKNYHWDKGYKALSETVYAFGIDGEALGLSELMTKMRSETFKTQLDEARYKMRGQYHLGDKEQMELSEKLFAQLASEFIDKKTYANEEEVNTLLEDNEYIPIGFVRTLVTTVSDEQLEILFDTIFRILTTKSIEFYSPFLGNLSSYSKYRKPLLKFLERLRNKRQELLYVSLMAVTENEELSHFYKLFSEQKNKF